MKIKDFVQQLNNWAPLNIAEDYDNVGLLVGNQEETVKKVMVNLEVTEEVLQEAIDEAANVLLTHHPLWFGKKYHLRGDDWVSRLLLRAIKHNIALVAFHTNLDNIPAGVNREIGNRLGLNELQILETKAHNPTGYDVIGSGMIGRLVKPLGKTDFLRHVQQVFGTPVLRYADTEKTEIETVAFCGGSGSFLLESAVAAGADAFLTGDITHHTFFDAEGKLLFVDIGHWESEQYTTELMLDFLNNNFANFAVCKSTVRTNPVNYFS